MTERTNLWRKGGLSRIFRCSAAFLFAVVLLSSCSKARIADESRPEEPSVSGTIEPGEYLGVYLEDISDELIRQTNEIRKENGLEPFLTDDGMSEWARIRSAELIFSFVHYRTDGTEIITAYPGVSYQRYYSAIARGYRTAESMLEAWMSLSYQRDNILSTQFTRVGAACILHNGVYYSVLVFLEP